MRHLGKINWTTGKMRNDRGGGEQMIRAQELKIMRAEMPTEMVEKG